jgi:hypothetical protein
MSTTMIAAGVAASPFLNSQPPLQTSVAVVAVSASGPQVVNLANNVLPGSPPSGYTQLDVTTLENTGGGTVHAQTWPNGSPAPSSIANAPWTIGPGEALELVGILGATGQTLALAADGQPASVTIRRGFLNALSA